MELVKNKFNLKILKNILIIFLCTVILTISAKIKIPFYPVPMTMQTFVVLLIGISLGWKIGLATVILYLFEGIVGFPVFSGTPEKGIGFNYFVGPTMGYLIGFLVAVCISGIFDYKDIFKSNILEFLKTYIKLLIAVSFIYLFGLIWLANLIGWEKPIFSLGAKPFLLAESFKLFLLTLIAGKFSKLRNFI
tara:strand:- start:1036 stop:1608 length:573 start_codon:yes stop_codon:yes gene_type:complete